MYFYWMSIIFKMVADCTIFISIYYYYYLLIYRTILPIYRVNIFDCNFHQVLYGLDCEFP